MIDSTVNKLLMSDSLKGMVPELEDDISQLASKVSNSVVIVAVELRRFPPLVGSLDGIQFEKSLIKLDMKVKTKEAFDAVKQITSEEALSSDAIQLHFGEEMTRIIGPYELTLPKVFGIDISSGMCVLGFDLIKT